MKPIRFILSSALFCLLIGPLNHKLAAQNDVTVDVNLGAEMVAPADGTTLTAPTVTFQWTPLDYVDQYWLSLGTKAGGYDLFNRSVGQQTSISLNGLPINGQPIFATLWSYAFGSWYHFVYQYPTAGAAQASQIFSPVNGSTFPGSSVTFTWKGVAQGLSYYLWVGTALDKNDLVSQSTGAATSWTITNLPQDGRSIFVKLWTWTGSSWQSTESQYHAALNNGSGTSATGNGSGSTGTGSDASGGKRVLRFDGKDDFVLIPQQASADSYTVSIWFKTVHPDCGIYMTTTTSLGDQDRNIYLNQGNLCARIWSDETISTANRNYADGNWHQVTHVYGGGMGGQKLFVDGQLAASGQLTKSAFTWQTHLRIGMSWGANNPFFQGDIFDVRLWNRALLANEILAQSQQIPNINDPNLIGYWTFGEAINSQDVLNSASQQRSGNGTLGADSQAATDDPQRVLYQATGGSSSGQTTVAAGLQYGYYEASISSAVPKSFETLTPVDTGVAVSFDLSHAKRSSEIGLVFNGYIYVSAAGNYTFFTTSDDGSLLFIDNEQVVNNDGFHGATEQSGTKNLAAGYHEIEVTFFQGEGPDALEVDWAGPGFGKQVIPSNLLFHAVTGN